MELEAYKFSSTASSEKPDILEGITPEEFLKIIYVKHMVFGLDNLKRFGEYRIHGWAFNFRPFMKRYYVEQYDMIYKEYAPNKTAIRKSTYGKIHKICERV